MVNLLVMIMLFALLEAAVRVFVPGIIPLGSDTDLFTVDESTGTRLLKPDARGKSYGILMQVDRNGFWKYNHSPDSDSIYTWLLLGDSVTMGIGVPQDENFGGVLQQKLQDSVLVLNASAIGYSVKDYYSITGMLFKRGIKPDRLTLVWCLNDIYADLTIESAPDKQLTRVRMFLRFLHRYVYSYQWLKAIAADRPKYYYEHDIALYQPNSRHLQRSMEIISKIQSFALQHNVEMDIWVMPYLEQIRQQDTDRLQLFFTYLDSYGIRYRDFYPVLAGHPNPENLFLYGDGIHFSREGHQIIGKTAME